jgi:anti-anti-sigma factor
LVKQRPDIRDTEGATMLSPAGSRDRREVPSPFSLDLREHSCDTLEVVLTGDLDSRTAGHLDDGLRWVVEHSPQAHVVVDVSGVHRLESPSLELLVRIRDELAADRRTLALRGQHGVVRNLLTIAGLLDPPPTGAAR